ncbi:hypothetical protein BKA67DRAFT_680163 [Truncatella angustata]|uniref:Fungal N-terminal domain-containing protein n=1 Tax=Truncatella angustata TaxID=152316 RepID=A0A9P8UGF6_9PEZI|nr:uncharacterized protein BKA67DRAFT_680163 [Truncatella angustata]KAH6651847.1 hypothetical protein BKA67DRAFT_680163 [Truncatella angustata]
MEAFGLVSAAAGVASFGITVCEGLLTYYSSWKDAYDTVRSMYENIEALAKTFVILERTISNPTLSEAARHRVEESIESCRKGIAALRKKLDKIEKSSAQQSWKERTWVRIKGTIYPFKESTLLKLKEGCIELRHDVGLALATLQINTSVRSLDKLAAFDERMFEVPNNIETILGNSNVLLNHMENLVASGKSILHLLVLFSRSVVVNLLIATKGEVLTKICDWLSPLAGDFERRQQELSSTLDRQEGMARWLFNTSEFKSWIHDTGTALWCTGMREYRNHRLAGLSLTTFQDGIGKSVLVSFVVDILHQARASEGVGVAYIYCNYEEAHRQSPSNLIAALLLQFVIQQNTVSEDLLSLYEHHMKNKTRPLLNEYLRLLQDTIAEFSKVLLRSHLKKDPSLHKRIIRNILQKTRSMFLLARLYIETLTRLITLRKVKSALNTLPDGLESMYHSVMVRIHGQDTELVTLGLNVLGWIYYAKRPLTLIELQHALAVEPRDTFLDEDGMPDKDLLTSVCGGLLSVQDGETVAFIHYTAQEFFDVHKDHYLKGARLNMAQTCLTYLSFDAWSTGACTTDGAFESRLKEYPFLEYASIHWGVHADLEGELSTDIEKLAVKTICSRKYKTNYVGYSQEFSISTPGLVLASAFGLKRIGSLLLQHDADIEDEDARGLRPIHQALWEGHDAMVQFLINEGADCEIPIGSHEPPQHSSLVMQGAPVHLASIKGNELAVDLLLAKSVNVNAHLENGWTALHMAAANGHSSVVSLLLRNGAEVNATDSAGGTAIYRAAETGQDGVIKLLVQHKGNVNMRTKLEQTPLLRAAENGHGAAVTLLLESGADWKIKDFLGWTPLYRAQDHGHDDVEKLLKKWIKEHREKGQAKQDSMALRG